MESHADEPPRRLLNPEALRLLAQPMRLRIQAQLQHGPANATSLARALGESTGLTSHHLRKLAQYGFVEEVPELARGRERWWRLARADWRLPLRNEQDPETRALMDEVVRQELMADVEEFTSAVRAHDNAVSGAWAAQLPYSRGRVYVTADQLQEFFEEYIKLLNRYQAAGQGLPDARPVVTSFMAYPAPHPGQEGIELP
jgi:predicted ArsR family transcriptional regulator